MSCNLTITGLKDVKKVNESIGSEHGYFGAYGGLLEDTDENRLYIGSGTGNIGGTGTYSRTPKPKAV